MKTLSQIIKEAEERFDYKFKHVHHPLIKAENIIQDTSELKDFLKTELTNIVKESFKNTRVEEKSLNYSEELSQTENDIRCNKHKFYNQALSDKHNKQNQFLNN